MKPITYIERTSGQLIQEKVFGEKAIRFLYGDDWVSRFLGFPFLHAVSRYSLFSSLYGWWQNRSFTKQKILPFIEKFEIDPEEFAKPIDQFASFNDFFIRRLKREARPFAESAAIIPADGRYLVYPEIHLSDGFVIKGEKFSLETLLDDKQLANDYRNGSMVIARLAPTDCHRFLFPCEGIPHKTHLINGSLYSVNPQAIRKDLTIFTQNKRTRCRLTSDIFDDVLLMEVGATSVGSITQTYTAENPVKKGDEKGYFSFGGSTLILLFKPGTITFAPDLIKASKEHSETLCLMGTPLCA